VKNVSADVSERQALSSLIRCSRSPDPVMKYGSLSTLMSRVDVGVSREDLWHCRDAPIFPIISGWERSGNRLKRLLSCVGMSKLLKQFLLFLRTMACDKCAIHSRSSAIAQCSARVPICTFRCINLHNELRPCYGGQVLCRNRAHNPKK